MSDTPAALSRATNGLDALFLPAAHPPIAPAWTDVSAQARPQGTARAAEQIASDIQLEVHTDLAEIAAEWRAFEKVALCTAFQSFHWVSKWLKHVGRPQGVRPAIVMGRDADGRLLFIFQLAVERHGLARRLTWLGSDLCDYNAPLLSPEFEAHCGPDRFRLLWQEVLASLRSEPRLGFDLIDLCKMPEAVDGRRNPFASLPVEAHPSGAYVATLGDDWERYYTDKRSGPTRKKERKQMRQLGEQGEIRFADGRERREIEHSLQILFTQKSRSFARMGVEDILARPGYRAFFHDIATDPETGDLAHVARLEVGGEAAAASYALRFRSRYYLILSSYHDGPVSRFGPGRAHLHELLRFAIDGKFAEFDFTIGDEPYKRDWSDQEPQLMDYLTAVTVRGWPVVAAKRAFRDAKRLVKQKPAVVQAIVRARALSGRLQKVVRRPG